MIIFNFYKYLILIHIYIIIIVIDWIFLNTISKLADHTTVSQASFPTIFWRQIHLCNSYLCSGINRNYMKGMDDKFTIGTLFQALKMLNIFQPNMHGSLIKKNMLWKYIYNIDWMALTTIAILVVHTNFGQHLTDRILNHILRLVMGILVINCEIKLINQTCWT